MGDPAPGLFNEVVRNGKVLTLLCEGLCSKAYTLEQRLYVSKLRAAGYSPEMVRAHMTARMTNTSHRETRRLHNATTSVVVVFYTCLGCGHERQYGIEELLA